ncbi:MAG: hypothetical protein K6356_00120 [Chloroflexus sp.]
MILLNYAHPLTPAQLEQVTVLLGKQLEIRQVPVHVDRGQPLADVARQLTDAAGLSPEEWQTEELVINPPGLAPLALTLIAEIHGRRGDFPPILNIRPVPDTVPTRYEIAEIVNLTAVRLAARSRR